MARLLAPANNSGSTAERKKPAEFLLGVMGNTLTIDRECGNAIDLRVTTLAFDSNRKRVASLSQAIATKLDAERAQKTLQTGLGIPEKIDLPPGKYEVKFAVRDNQEVTVSANTETGEAEAVNIKRRCAPWSWSFSCKLTGPRSKVGTARYGPRSSEFAVTSVRANLPLPPWQS